MIVGKNELLAAGWRMCSARATSGSKSLRVVTLGDEVGARLLNSHAASTIPARTSRTRFDPLSSVATVLPGNRRGYRVDFDPAIGLKVYQMVYPSKNPDADRRGLPRVMSLKSIPAVV
jgi:hypothetical protein